MWGQCFRRFRRMLKAGLRRQLVASLLVIAMFYAFVFLRVYLKNRLVKTYSSSTESTSILENSHQFFDTQWRIKPVIVQRVDKSVPSVNKMKPTCVHQPLLLWHPALKPYFRTYKKYTCDRKEDWVYVQNGTFQIYPDMIQKHGLINCSYVPLIRGNNDNDVLEGTKIEVMKTGTVIPSDFFRTECNATSGTTNSGLHAGVSIKETLKARGKLNALPKDALGMNILMFGFDSVSHMTWLRNLPQSSDYFVNTLGGIVLDGYNIVGDGTPQAWLPILTGQTEWELPEARRGKPNAKPVDGHPWIWDKLKNAGYITQFGEDKPGQATFNYRMLGFERQPVDYYLRPFYLKLQSDKTQLPRCVGAKPRHQMMMDWIKELYIMYPNTPKFSFLFHTEFTHDGYAELKNADLDLLNFLRYMHEGGHLNNTLLILMADHGARFQAVRKTTQGKFEERLPFFSFRFPPTFAKKYPQIVQNMRTNVNRLTTPFDIHETFLNVLHFNASVPGNRYKRGVSLFHEVPLNRTCANADIEVHWCACLDWRDVTVNDSSVQGAAKAFVETLNNITLEQREKCAILDVHSVSDAKKFTPSEGLLKFKKSADRDGRKPDLSDKMSSSEEMLQLSLETIPGHGQFEVTLTHYLNEGIYKVSTKDISRINRYGNQPHCVMNELPHLRPYCYCKNQLPVH